MQEVLISKTATGLANKEQLIAVISSLKIGHYRIIIKDARSRSIPQNAYYWGVLIPMVKQGLRDAGYDEVQDNMDAHEVLKHLHLKKRIVSRQTGDTIDIAGSSAKLTIPEFNDYIERICKWSSEWLNVVIPAPNEVLGRLDEYISEQEIMADEGE